jgi:hypothetical protein
VCAADKLHVYRIIMDVDPYSLKMKLDSLN